MQDRFKFKAIVKGYYYIDTPDKCEEFEPLIFLENIDVLDIGDIGISEEDLEIAIRKQYSDLQDIYVERMMEIFRDNSNGVDTYITITPEQIYQCTGLKDKNGKLIYEGDILGGTYGNLYIHYCDNCKQFELKANDYGCMACEGDVHWYELVESEDENELEVIGNIYENPKLLEDK